MSAAARPPPVPSPAATTSAATSPAATSPAAHAGAPSPLTADEFGALLDPLGPFEAAPRLAVAVSGGPDSLALLRLADVWARRRGGAVAALTVDHRLRPEAAAEARQVGAWCAAAGIDHHVLVRPGEVPPARVQEAARDARYALLTGWCRDRGVVHLLLGHHLHDQAETFLYRLGRGSGSDGLAAMPAVAARDGVRLLRPLLAVAPARLAATLAAAGQDWISDPANRDRRYARVVARDRVARLAELGVAPAAIAAAAAAMGRLRADADSAQAALAARCLTVFPEGYAEIDAAALFAAGDQPARRLLAAVLTAVGGREHGPRRAALARLDGDLRQAAPRPRTLGGCVVERPGGTTIRICREPRATPAVAAPDTPGALRWDGRLTLGFAAAAPGHTVAALGAQGWETLAAGDDRPSRGRLPGRALFGLPALWRGGEVVEVPHLGYRRNTAAPAAIARAVFAPRRPVAGAPFWVA